MPVPEDSRRTPPVRRTGGPLGVRGRSDPGPSSGVSVLLVRDLVYGVRPRTETDTLHRHWSPSRIRSDPDRGGRSRYAVQSLRPGPGVQPEGQ